MNFILELLINAGVFFLLAYMLPQVHIKSFLTALWVALLVSLLNATIGALLRFPLNLVTFYLLSFVVRLVVTALIIKLVDKLVRNFEVKGFWPALVIAIALAIAGTLINRDEAPDGNNDYDALNTVQTKQILA